jgi:hypothetical protein
MIIYNVTININNEVHDEWFRWMKDVHIPEVMATGYFIDWKMCKVLVEEETGITYSIQYTSSNMADLQAYQKEHASRLQKIHADKYKDKYVAFRTLLEIV